MDFDTDINDLDEDAVEPCRTCGVFFTKSQDLERAIVKPIFSPTLMDKTGSEVDMPDILQQLQAWDMEVVKDDGRPQYMCVVCIAEFRKVLKFKRSCLEAQQQYEELELKPFEMNIKKEIDVPPEQEEKFVAFVYLSDEESFEEDGSTRVRAAFDIPHVPIKEEHMARVPALAVDIPNPEAQASNVKITKLEASAELDKAIDIVAIEDESNGDNENDEDEDIIKFTYDYDGSNDANLNLPLPLFESKVYCKLCTYESSDQDQHMDHMRRVHMLKDCECHICGKKFVNVPESRLKFHMKWHKLQRHMKCPICGFFCNSKDTLKEHNLAVHTKTKCKFCGKKMKHKLLQSHINEHLEEREAELAQKLNEAPPTALNSSCVIQCAFCEDTFGNAQELQNHVLATHKLLKTEPSSSLGYSSIPMETDGESEIESTLDESQTSQNSIIESQLNLGQYNDSSQCTSNFETTSTSTSAEMSPSLSSTAKASYNCPICNKSFNLKIKLNRHFKNHTQEPF
ncbi:LOW QUALITY PROTEIN: zinc finger imprinted 3 [Drosophila tropicalis]|uniref:LOW QUALITY PROTEIN: zinc finger imprinted 3 n=1 Tax=Drosophila tropicalis TaxID=46794 RepID=UPI0035ABA178